MNEIHWEGCWVSHHKCAIAALERVDKIVLERERAAAIRASSAWDVLEQIKILSKTRKPAGEWTPLEREVFDLVHSTIRTRQNP